MPKRHLDKRTAPILQAIDKLPPDLLLSAAEAAQVLGVSGSFMIARRTDGTGPRYTRLGRMIRHRVDDLREWVAGRQHVSTAEYKDAPSIPKGCRLEQRSHGTILHWPAKAGTIRRRSLWETSTSKSESTD